MYSGAAAGFARVYSLRVSNEFSFDLVRNTIGAARADGVVRWFVRALLEDSYARLVVNGAGELSRVSLAPMYIDLDLQRGAGERPEGAIGFFDALVRRSDADLHNAWTDERDEPLSRDWMLFGGPGQGKSTLTQWAALVHWHALLDNKYSKATALTKLGFKRRTATELEQRMSEIKTRVNESGGPRAGGWLALRVELPEYVEFLSTQKQPEQPLYLFAAFLASKHNSEVSTSEWAMLVRVSRCLLLFDALDEVTTPEARVACSEMIEAVREASGEGSRTIVTSRPQGYDGSLGLDHAERQRGGDRAALGRATRGEFLFLRVAPLRPPRALELVDRILGQQSGSSARDRAKVRQAIEQSLEQQATSELLRVPLFVSIVLPLVDMRGRVPDSRRRLLEGLYEILVNRESTKDRTGRLRELIESYRWALDGLHAQVALMLHVRGQELGARTALSIDELRALTDAVVCERIDLVKMRTQLVDDLLFFSRDRLVLLVQHEQGFVRFDVRLVQEFFAERALFDRSAPLELRSQRLRAIATDSHWRQVLAFAVDNFASSDDRDMFDVLAKTLVAANEGKSAIAPDAMRLARRGASVAIELLQRGALASSPREQQTLWKIAIGEDGQWWPESIWSYAAVAVELAKRDRALVDALVDRCARAWNARRDVRSLCLLNALSVGFEDSVAQQAIEELIAADIGVVDELFQVNRWRGESKREDVDERREARAKALRKRYTDRFDPLDPFDSHPDSRGDTVREAWSTIRGRRIIYKSFDSVGNKSLSVLTLGDAQPWRDLAIDIPDEMGRWLPLKLVADFCSRPSPESLAICMRRLLESRPPDVVAQLDLPWLMVALLRRVARGEPLTVVLESIERGAYGDAQTWRQEEASPLLQRWPDEHREEASLLLEGWRRYVDNASTQWAEELWTSSASSVFEQLAARSRYAAVLFAWSVRLVPPSMLAAASLDRETFRWLLDVGAVSVQTLPSVLPAPEEASAFLDSLDKKVVDELLVLRPLAPLQQHEDWIPRAFEWFVTAASAHPNASVFAALAVLATECPIPPAWIPALEALPLRAGSEVAWARIQLISSASMSEHAAKALEVLAVRSDVASTHRTAVAKRWIDDRAPPTKHRMALASALWAVTPEDGHETRKHIRALARRYTESLPGVMANAASRASTGLRLLDPMKPTIDTAVSDEIVALANVRIENVRCIETMDFSPKTPASADRGQWIVLLGDNGVGKTSILRALALALVKPSWVPRTAELTSARMVRRGAIAASCRAQVRIGHVAQEHRCDFVVGEDRDEQWKPNGENGRPFVVAYGVHRSALEDQKGGVSKVHEPQAIHALLYPNIQVVNPTEWSATLGAHDDNVFSSIRESLEQALRPAGVDEVRLSNNEGFLFSGPSVGRDVPLSLLSDGYLSTVGWIVDVMARWVAACKRMDRPISRGFQRVMAGVVLVDEIDLHLHPRWQREFVETIRTVFPRLTFVATTHNPLTALELAEGELFGLVRGADGRVTIRELPSMRGRRVDEVLTGEWFELGSTLDDDTLALMEEHRLLLRDNDDEERRHEIEEMLRDRIGRYAELSIERMALGVAREIMDEDREKWRHPERTSSDQRAALRKELMARVRARLSKHES